MSSKDEDSYRQLFQILCDKCENLGIVLDPITIILDFEKSMINAVHNFFGAHVNVKGCFFHLCKSSWRKVQELGLAQQYMEDNDVQLFCGMLDGLAFLPVDRVLDGMEFLRQHT